MTSAREAVRAALVAEREVIVEIVRSHCDARPIAESARPLGRAIINAIRERDADAALDELLDRICPLPRTAEDRW